MVFPDALELRVLKSRNIYINKVGNAGFRSPIRLNFVSLRQSRRGDGRATGDRSHGPCNAEEFAHRLAGPRGRKNAAGCAGKLTDPLMFAAAMVSAGKADVCIVVPSSTERAACRITHYRLAARL
ncbi:hypothetical protein ACVXHA_15175 [Escherichia coli]